MLLLIVAITLNCWVAPAFSVADEGLSDMLVSETTVVDTVTSAVSDRPHEQIAMTLYDPGELPAEYKPDALIDPPVAA